jgi:hypothetical protein
MNNPFPVCVQKITFMISVRNIPQAYGQGKLSQGRKQINGDKMKGHSLVSSLNNRARPLAFTVRHKGLASFGKKKK